MSASALPADLQQALAQLEAQLAHGGRTPALLMQIARLRAQLGALQHAEQTAREAHALDRGLESLRLLGQLMVHQGRAAEAAALCRSSGLEMAEADLWEATHLIQSGQHAAAMERLDAGLSRFPSATDLRLQRAALHMGLGRVAAALEDLKSVHAHEPHNLGAWLLLARARLVLGDAAGAEQCLVNAERLQPNLPAQACFQMAGVLQERKAFSEAATYYQRAIAADPTSFLYRGNYADMLCSIGRIEDGMMQHRRILEQTPDRLRSHLALGLTLPGVLADADAIKAARDHWSQALDALVQRTSLFAGRPVEELEADLRWSNYLLAYHGEDDLSLQKQFSSFQTALLDKAIPAGKPGLGSAAGNASGRLRVGFASSFFYQCTVGWYFSSWITDLDREMFDVHVYSLGPVRDELSERLAHGSVFKQVHHLGLRALAELIRRDELDVLVFPELGLCPTTYALAAMRNAPLQCAGWGHPVTSGHRNIDCFFSSAEMEPADADRHYSETLVRLPGMGTRYAMPDTRDDLLPRSVLGLPEEAVFALVSQSLFKLHPESDALYLRVLAARPDLHCVFFEDSYAANTESFRKRFFSAASEMGIEVESRTHFLGRMNRQAFLAVNRHAWLMLDGLRWSGGNTSLDALACGLPVVTLPGEFMRGRQSMAMLETVECPELIARDQQDYLRIALRLLDDAAFRAEMMRRIRVNASRLFNQTAGTLEFARVLRERAGRQ